MRASLRTQTNRSRADRRNVEINWQPAMAVQAVIAKRSISVCASTSSGISGVGENPSSAVRAEPPDALSRPDQVKPVPAAFSLLGRHQVCA
jgi:hypothetical protein